MTTNLQTIVTPDVRDIARADDKRREACIIRAVIASQLAGQGESLRNIAAELCKDHTTIINTLKRHENDYLTSPAYRLICQTLLMVVEN